MVSEAVKQRRLARLNDWRAANPDLYRESQKRIIARNRAFVEGLKAQPCSDCGGRFPSECMDFDHLADKSAGVSYMATRTSSLKRLAAEIEKCELVCANCHRIRTRQRRQHVER